MSEHSAEKDTPLLTAESLRRAKVQPRARWRIFGVTARDIDAAERRLLRVLPPAAWDDPDPDDPPATEDDDPMWGRPIPPGGSDA